jgi:hypothetical protein
MANGRKLRLISKRLKQAPGASSFLVNSLSNPSIVFDFLDVYG